ncbi:MAG: hypothetical protein COB02_04825 [Candidatus Cloacimonadota bacterium]|nr:MAG: hypothetical protein COB02_04825 [Candidatus Cloacimonadota bacterium]
MLALFTICILCFSLDTILIQELTKPYLHFLWIPALAWVLSIFFFSLIADKSKYLIYLLQLLYLSLFLPIIGAKLNPLIPNFSLQLFCIFFVAMTLAIIEAFPPSLIKKNLEQNISFQQNKVKVNLLLLFSSIKIYIILILFLALFLLSLFHPLFIASANVMDHLVLFVISIPFIYSTRRLQ